MIKIEDIILECYGNNHNEVHFLIIYFSLNFYKNFFRSKNFMKNLELYLKCYNNSM